MDYFQKLPVEVIRPIFKHLSLNDLLRLRLVSKKVKIYCDSAFIDDQIVSDRIGIFKQCWFHRNKRIMGNKDIVSLNQFIKFTLITELSSHLKRLNLNCIANKNFKLVHLDGFTRLKHLEINFQMFGNQTTNLKSLKLLKIKDFIEGPKFYLNCPKLEIISINDLSLVEFAYPSTVKYLRTSTYVEAINSLENLEVIKFFYLMNLNSNILRIFKNLKQLHLFVELDLFLMGYYTFKDDIQFILNQKNNLNRLDFKLFFEGVHIDESKLDAIGMSRLDFQLKNYNSLNVDLSFFHHLNYTELNSCCFNDIPNNIPVDFFQKFFNICFVRVDDQVDNPDHLNWVLGKISRFHVLEFYNTFLNQVFYENLSNVCEIRRLIINEKSDLEDKLPNMFELAIELFINSIYLKRLEISYMNKSIEIRKLNDYCYNLRFDDMNNAIKICENSLYFYELCESCFEIEKNQLKINQRTDIL